MKTYGYVRVSARDQNEERQLIAMSAQGIDPEDIIVEKCSGKDFDRPGWQELTRKTMKPGDTLVVRSIDRLGRNYDEILQEWRYLTRELGAYIVVQDMPLLDTRHTHDLTGTLIADVVLQLLSYVAEKERENIRQRQAEGIAAAKARGVRFGHEVTPVPECFPPIYQDWKAGKLTANQAAARCGVSSRYAFHRIRRKYELELSAQLGEEEND